MQRKMVGSKPTIRNHETMHHGKPAMAKRFTANVVVVPITYDMFDVAVVKASTGQVPHSRAGPLRMLCRAEVGVRLSTNKLVLSRE